jgi:hypothetical protein
MCHVGRNRVGNDPEDLGKIRSYRWTSVNLGGRGRLGVILGSELSCVMVLAKIILEGVV